MEDLTQDTEFISETVVQFVEDAINLVFGIKEGEQANNVWFVKDKVNQWCNQIIDSIIRQLSKDYKPFKYCVTCIIEQNVGADLWTTGGGFFDNSSDGIIGVQKEIGDILVIVAVFAMKISAQ